MFSLVLLVLSFLKETLISGYHECLIKEIFSDIFSVSGAPNRMEKGMKILGLTTLWPVAHYKLLVLFFSHSVFLLNNNNNNYYSL